MRWNSLESRYRRYLGNWHPTFAFFPKKIGDTVVWLEFYESRRYRVSFGYSYEYRLIEKK